MSDKLNIGNEMRQLDSKNREFYDSLTDEERKKFSNYLMIRWSSSVQGAQEMQEYYVQSCNHYLNKHFFTINQHPKLQWLCATAISPGLGLMKHDWLAPKKKDANDSAASAKKKQLMILFPNLKGSDIDALATINSQKDIDSYKKDLGQ
jgi:hypothetical protein